MIQPILCTLAILLSFSNIFAQDNPIKFGAKFGFSHSNLDMPSEVTQYDGFGSTDNFHLGVFSEIELVNNLGLKAEVYIVRREERHIISLILIIKILLKMMSD